MAAVPTLAPEEYARRVRADRPASTEHATGVRFPLPGGQGTVTVLEDGRGAVHNALGQSVGVLDPGTVAAITPRPADAPRTPQPSAWRDVVTAVTSWARERGLTVR